MLNRILKLMLIVPFIAMQIVQAMELQNPLFEEYTSSSYEESGSSNYHNYCSSQEDDLENRLFMRVQQLTEENDKLRAAFVRISSVLDKDCAATQERYQLQQDYNHLKMNEYLLRRIIEVQQDEIKKWQRLASASALKTSSPQRRNSL